MTKLAGGDYNCAASLIEGFLKSEDEPIQTSAEAAHLVYKTVAELEGEMLRVMQGDFGAKEHFAASQLLDKKTDIGVKRSQAWRVLPIAGAAAAHALVLLPEKPDERLSRLRITQSERNELLKRIEQVFGPSVKQGRGGGLRVVAV